MNQLATVEVIHSFETHTNADSLELAKVLGFQVVVKKGQFKDGEIVVFIWPDTLCAVAEWNKFLAKDDSGKPVRIKSCKLRGEFSTGLVVPYSVLGSFGGPAQVGDEVAVPLNVMKYVKDEGGGNGGEPGGNFPSEYISKTDEDLAQSSPRTQQEFLNEVCYKTLKIDGQSGSFINYNEEIRVCSRNLEIKDGDNKFWNTVRKYKLIERTKGMNIAIQYEQAGPGIQQNKLGLKEIEMFIFNIKNLDTGKYYGYDELCTFCDQNNLPMVPILGTITYEDGITFDQLQKQADELKYQTNGPAEGFVLRPIIPKYSQSLHKMLSVKFINRNYKD